MSALLLKQFSPAFKIHSRRVGLVAVITLFFVHLLVYEKFPFDEGYIFPTIPWTIAFLYGIVICTVNYVVTRKITLPEDTPAIRRFWEHFKVVVVSTFLTYSALYVIIVMVVFRRPFDYIHFIKFLVLCMAIMAFEYILIKALVTSKRNQTDPKVKIRSGRETYLLSQDEIALFHSSGGLVMAYTKADRKIITQFNSLDEVEKQLSSSLFFKLSRQLLVNIESVQGYRSIENRRLQIDLNPTFRNGFRDDLIVSRYKSKEFKDWINNDSDSA